MNIENKARPRVLSVTVNDIRSLRAAFMPFIKKCGLFVPTDTDYQMGDEVFLVLNIFGTEQHAVGGSVIWLTPIGAQSSRTKGVGVQFKGDDGEALRSRIVELLMDNTSHRGATHTL